MALSNTKIKAEKPREKPFKLSDGGGLFLHVAPNGSKLWRMKYRFNDREKSYSIGVYPAVSLKEARKRRDKAREMVANGIDPSAMKQIERAARSEAGSFREVTLEWLEMNNSKWSLGYAKKSRERLKNNLFPYIGNMKMDEITAPLILAALRRMESRGVVDMAHRVKGLASQVFRYAVATGRAERDPTQDLQGALKPNIPESFPAITDPNKIGVLMKAIDSFEGTIIVEVALKLSALFALRPGELRKLTWGEIDIENALISIPAHKMKKRRDHLLPLAQQAIALLKTIQPLTDRGEDSYVFPSIRSSKRPMSENTINASLRRLGYTKEEMVPHGFRTTFSSSANDNNWDERWVEMQLAHKTQGVKGVYNRAKYLDQRRRMLQWWADYLDQLRDGVEMPAADNVVNLKQA
ncbi:MAG: tyrosine-type recombinase/integrase [Candidatus Marinimicrobia bacterium]|nr:tyrosine-type recombinase/integrase [Candidatus Neomarinimicrobiota bacterium]MBT5291039.1 tyrosine-type recombinase/integrase [Thiotrichales bacterium]MBT7828809.1 tyrosine-type recombinase/integrase [Candidatus Neomarinimicrobiota bacterium]